MSVTVHGVKYERGDDGWLHSVHPDEDGEYVMTPDNGQPDDPVEEEDDDG
jgi:hypothetical protein